MLLSLIVNTIANLLLIPTLGIAGAAIGTTIAIGCQMSCLYFLSIVYGLTFEKRMLAALVLPSVILIDVNFWWVGVLIVLGTACGGMLFSKQDFVVLKSSFNQIRSRLGRSHN